MLTKKRFGSAQVVFTGLILLIASVQAAWGAYIDNDDGTVTDTTAGLTWQKADDGLTRTWENALTYCEDLDLAGNTNWRLPNIRELLSIVDDGRYLPAINPVFSCRSSNYWSSSTMADGPDMAWQIHAGGGVANNKSKNLPYYVRCVRGTPEVSSIYGIFVGNNFIGDDLKAGSMATDIYNIFSNLRNVVYKKLIINEGSTPVSQSRIKNEIDKIKNIIRPNDIFFIFIAGHGSSDLVGFETTLTQGDEYIVLADGFPFDSSLLTDDELTGMLSGLDNVDKWVVIDACRAGGFWGDFNPIGIGDLEKLKKISFFPAVDEVTGSPNLRLTDYPITEDRYQNHPDFRKPLFGIAIREALTKKENGNVLADIDNGGQGNGLLTFSELKSWVRNNARAHLEEMLGLIIEGEVLGTSDYGGSIVFSWNEWNPEGQQSGYFSGSLETKSSDTTIAKANGPYFSEVAQPVTLDASGSSSPNGNIVLFEWDINNDGIYELSTSSATIIFTYSEPYDGTVKLKVTDNKNLTDIDSASIFVSSGLEGDFDNDSDVDGSDLAVFITNPNGVNYEDFVTSFGLGGL